MILKTTIISTHLKQGLLAVCSILASVLLANNFAGRTRSVIWDRALCSYAFAHAARLEPHHPCRTSQRCCYRENLEIHAPSAPKNSGVCGSKSLHAVEREVHIFHSKIDPSWMRSGREHVCSIPLTQERVYIVSIYLSKTRCPPFSTIQLESLETFLLSPCFFPIFSKSIPSLHPARRSLKRKRHCRVLKALAMAMSIAGLVSHWT